MKKSGILLHISSLPSPYGIGTLGKVAFDFIDFLAETNQSYWQILPLNPTGWGNSPYQSCSAFAGNEYFIDLDILVRDKLLKQKELDAVNWNNTAVDYGFLYEHKYKLLKTAYERFKGNAGFDRFCDSGRAYEYALFMAQKNPGEDIRYRMFLQFLFFKQWAELRKYADNKGIGIIGDMPIYVAHDSVDVKCNPKMFKLDKDGLPECVAGVPPDYFSETGQLWGNPIYNWDYIKRTGYAWWIERFTHAMNMFHALRIDHFRGFSAYYTIPYGKTDAKDGKWIKGPGMDLFNAIKKSVPGCRIIAENLGVSDKNLTQLIDESGYPSMAVVQFGLDFDLDNEHLPLNYQPNMAVYSGTHDNDTLMGYLCSLDKNETMAMLDSVKYCCKKMKLPFNKKISVSETADLIISFLMKSEAETVIIPMQDWLQLGSEARMNIPSVVSVDNWTFRISGPELKSNALKDKIRRITALRN